MSNRGKKSRKQLPSRKSGFKNLKKDFLIVTNGTKTEYNYFVSWKSHSEKVVLEVKKDSNDPRALLERTLRIREEIERRKSKQYGIAFSFDETWCVFDKDEFPDENISQAISIAKQNNIEIAYSNEAFELWLLLHFSYYNHSMSRKILAEKLDQKYIEKHQCKYEKEDELHFSRLVGLTNKAIINAKKLNTKFENEHIIDINKKNPCTSVHFLVEKL